MDFLPNYVIKGTSELVGSLVKRVVLGTGSVTRKVDDKGHLLFLKSRFRRLSRNRFNVGVLILLPMGRYGTLLSYVDGN